MSFTPRPIEILCFVAYYLPGYRSGGPARTIANLVDHLGDQFSIRIVTRDKDFLDAVPYPNVVSDEWSTVGKAKVFYASDKTVNIRGISKIIRESSHDILYLNSFFDYFTILPLLTLMIGVAPRKPCVIAPRGEFSEAALALKKFKKLFYIVLARALGLYNDLYWQASNDRESQNILRVLGLTARRVYVAPDLTPVVTRISEPCSARVPGPKRLVFLSRISPMKNLDFILRVLGRVMVDVEFGIYGPQEDQLYWRHCINLIAKLPKNIIATVHGQVPQEKVSEVFSEHDMFIFPTRGENFGHVIFESLVAGTPVLTSDQTPWVQDVRGGVTVLPLDEDLWIDAITAFATLGEEALAKRREAAAVYASAYSRERQHLEQNRKLFQLVAARN